jgi:hypothetical protein
MSLIQPVFVTYDEKEREAYLSQVGNFSPTERSIFHKLCRVWEPMIPYIRFTSMINRDTANSTAELMRLMAKLSKAHMGIISSKFGDGTRNPEGIIICEPGQQIFFSYTLEEEILDVFENLLLPLPNQISLSEKNLPIPGEYVRELSYEQAAEYYINKNTKGGEIFSLPNQSGNAFLMTQGSLVRYLSIAISKMRSTFQNSNTLAMGASFMEMSLTELKTKLAAKEPAFWKDLSGTLLEQKDNLLAQRKVKLPDDVFDLCRFLNRFLTAQIKVAKEKKAKDEEKVADMAALSEIILKSDNYLVPQELFEKHLDSFREKYGDYYDNFRSDFDKAYLQPEASRNLPIILKIEGNLIHEDNIKPLFLQRVEKLSRELYKHYLPLMSKYIRSRQSDMQDIFHSAATFESDIEDRIKEMDHLTSVLLTRPATVAEAFIQAGRKTRELNTVEEMKSVLVSFFYPDEIKFKELQVIFNLSVKDMYQHSFLNFSILRQLIMRITGRHDSFRKKFEEQARIIYRRMETEAALPSNYAGVGPRSRGSGSSGSSGRSGRSLRQSGRGVSGTRRLSEGRSRSSRGSGSSGAASSSAGTSTVGSGEEAAKKRLYSVKERDQAWQEFSKSLKK